MRFVYVPMDRVETIACQEEVCRVTDYKDGCLLHYKYGDNTYTSPKKPAINMDTSLQLADGRCIRIQQSENTPYWKVYVDNQLAITLDCLRIRNIQQVAINVVALIDGFGDMTVCNIVTGVCVFYDMQWCILSDGYFVTYCDKDFPKFTIRHADNFHQVSKTLSGRPSTLCYLTEGRFLYASGTMWFVWNWNHPNEAPISFEPAGTKTLYYALSNGRVIYRDLNCIGVYLQAKFDPKGKVIERYCDKANSLTILRQPDRFYTKTPTHAITMWDVSTDIVSLNLPDKPPTLTELDNGELIGLDAYNLMGMDRHGNIRTTISLDWVRKSFPFPNINIYSLKGNLVAITMNDYFDHIVHVYERVWTQNEAKCFASNLKEYLSVYLLPELQLIVRDFLVQIALT